MGACIVILYEMDQMDLFLLQNWFTETYFIIYLDHLKSMFDDITKLIKDRRKINSLDTKTTIIIHNQYSEEGEDWLTSIYLEIFD